jgi:hypothetical protein
MNRGLEVMFSVLMGLPTPSVAHSSAGVDDWV